MVKAKGVLFSLLFLLLSSVPAYATSVSLWNWAFNINGDTYEHFGANTLPSNLDDSSFDWTSGIGVLSLSFVATGGNDNYSVSAFFDHEIDESTNSFFNEFGVEVGTPGVGQSWEIDEPGHVSGDIYSNFLVGALDNTNGVPSGSDDDISMALGWNVVLAAGETLVIGYTISDIAPLSGFYLTHTDPDSNYSLYFSSTVAIDTSPVPEPATFILLGSGLAGLAFYRRKRK